MNLRRWGFDIVKKEKTRDNTIVITLDGGLVQSVEVSEGGNPECYIVDFDTEGSYDDLIMVDAETLNGEPTQIPAYVCGCTPQKITDSTVKAVKEFKELRKTDDGYED